MRKIKKIDEFYEDKEVLVERNFEQMKKMLGVTEEDTVAHRELTEEELEAQRVDAAERENHRKEVEGEL